MKRWIGILILGLAFVLCPSARAQAVQHGINVGWTASVTTGVTGYNVYESATSGGPYTKLNSTPVTGVTYSDLTATDGKVHNYVITSLEPCTGTPGCPTSGVIESALSTQVTATAFLVPASPTQPTATPF